MEPCQHVRFVLLVLGITLGGIQQAVARGQRVSCTNSTHYRIDKNICCHRCQPGHYVKADCTPTTVTHCLPCENGTFASNWNFAHNCRKCYPCSSHLVEKTPCNATKAAVCVCPDGYSCTMYDPLGVCQICTPDPVSIPTETIPTWGPTESPSGLSPTLIWIIAALGVSFLTSLVIVLCVKSSLVKRFGRLIKNKKCSESVPRPETAVEVVSGHVIPLLDDERIKIPLQENENSLNYPIQESSTSEIGESTLIPKRMNI